MADTVRPVMERIYEDKKDQLDSNIYFPITDGHLGYNVPVNLLKCKNTDGAEIYKIFSKVVMFTTIDDAWREHLREMDDLRQSVQNATYEQKDPLLIYKFESFGLFSKMIVRGQPRRAGDPQQGLYPRARPKTPKPYSVSVRNAPRWT